MKIVCEFDVRNNQRLFVQGFVKMNVCDKFLDFLCWPFLQISRDKLEVNVQSVGFGLFCDLNVWNLDRFVILANWDFWTVPYYTGKISLNPAKRVASIVILQVTIITLFQTFFSYPVSTYRRVYLFLISCWVLVQRIVIWINWLDWSHAWTFALLKIWTEMGFWRTGWTNLRITLQASCRILRGTSYANCISRIQKVT